MQKAKSGQLGTAKGPLSPMCPILCWLLAVHVCVVTRWGDVPSTEAMCSLREDILERGAQGGGVGCVSPYSRTHLGAVAARLARWQVLAEPMAQMCGTEPSTGGAARLELKGRWAAVLWKEREECWWRDSLGAPSPTKQSACSMVPVTPWRGHLVADSTRLSFCCLSRQLSQTSPVAPA